VMFRTPAVICLFDGNFFTFSQGMLREISEAQRLISP
jgi:hypothetical protein